ncbi:MAG TPA: autotransporter-associated beta strand repeat-containing protein, partial [Verrucomicrobiae bacterium]
TISSTANDGFLQLASSGAAANAAGINIANNNTGSSTLQLTGGIIVPPPVNLNGRNTNVVAIENVSGSNTLSGNLSINSGGSYYLLQSDAGTLNFGGTISSVVSGSRTLTFMGAGNFLVSGTLANGSATVSVVKTNAGTLTINSSATWSGGTTLSQGILQANASGAFGPGTLTVDSGANTARIILGNGVTITNSITANTVNSGGGSIGLVMAADNTSATWSGPITFNANATAGGHFAGPTTSGLLTIAGPVNSGATNILIIRAGNLRFSGGGSYGEIQPRANTTSLGANNGIAVNAVMDIGGNGSTMVPTAFDLNGFNQTLAGLKNSVTAANAAWVTNSAATPNTLTLNLGATNFSFGGSLVGKIALTLNSGVQTLAKSGTTALNGLYTYSGNTTVAGGTLALASGISLPNTPVVTIASGATLDASASGLTLGLAQTLGGAGTVLGNLTVNGTLMPGSGGMEVLSCSNNVTLNAGCTNYLELNKSAGTNDQLRVAGSLAYGGQLLVTNLNGSLSGGDTFKLFSAVSSSGNFTTLAGSPGAGLDWKFNPTNGALTVYSTVVTNLTIRVTNSALLISWPADHVGWTLQVQTNALNAGLGTNWISILNTATNTQFAAPLDAGNPAVFYRLIYQ